MTDIHSIVHKQHFIQINQLHPGGPVVIAVFDPNNHRVHDLQNADFVTGWTEAQDWIDQNAKICYRCNACVLIAPESLACGFCSICQIEVQNEVLQKDKWELERQVQRLQTALANALDVDNEAADLDCAHWITDDGVLSTTCGPNITKSTAANPKNHRITRLQSERIEKYAVRMINIAVGAFWKPRADGLKRALRRTRRIATYWRNEAMKRGY